MLNLLLIRIKLLFSSSFNDFVVGIEGLLLKINEFFCNEKGCELRFVKDFFLSILFFIFIFLFYLI